MANILIWLLGTLLLATIVAMLTRHLGPETLVGVYVGSLVTAIVVAGKIGLVQWGNNNIGLSASIFVYSATFLMTDVLAEIYGKRMARKAVYGGFLTYFILMLTTNRAVDWTPHPFWQNQEAFQITKIQQKE